MAFVLKTVGDAPVCLSDGHFVFFNNLQSPEGFVTHTGDNRTGVGEGDDETLKIDLAVAPEDAVEVSFIVTMHEALTRRQHFGMVQNAYLKVYNDETGEVLAEYDLDEEFAGQTAVQMFVGIITSNNFMKRDFGKPLVENVLANLDLSLIVDTSQAFIPFHGTPTVLLFGVNRRPSERAVRAVMGKRGETGIPPDPAKGKVWLGITKAGIKLASATNL